MLTTVAFVICAVMGLAQVATISTVVVRFMRPPKPSPFAGKPPLVSIVRPICGLENNLEACFASSFRLTYPNYEIIFCAEDEADEAVPLARRIIAEHPEIEASLLIGRDEISANPKLNNCVKGWRAAKSDWVIFSDSNTILPADYVESLWSRWGKNTGCVSTPAEAGYPKGFAADLECVFLNSLQARLVLAGDSWGLGYALGKTLMYHKPTMEQLGGLPRLGEYAAEDVATSHAIHKAGLKAHLAHGAVMQPLGRRSFRAVLKRQIRWARLRRQGVPVIYAAEIINGGVLPIGCAIGLAIAGAAPIAFPIAFAAGWYGLETILIPIARWPLAWRMPAAMILRDLLLPVIWVAGLFGNRFEWRGNAMTVAKTGDKETYEAEPG
jgi:ceramide glucosyltransferase